MRIVIATDSFKGSLTAKEVGDAITVGAHRSNPSHIVDNIPMADGGEGTVQSLIDATGGSLVSTTVHDPLMRPIQASYGILGDGVTAVIEMAAASGLPLLSKTELNPSITTTYGTGELILHALDKGCRTFIIGLGGSATNDGGKGMLEALGVRFFDHAGNPLSHGGLALRNVQRIDLTQLDTRLKESHIKVACDVENPLCGKHGASETYGPQKGASPKVVQLLDSAMSHYAEVVERDFSIALKHLPGSGAAGGLGAALLGFLDGQFSRGIDLVIKTTGLEKYISEADLVITGEGKIDSQTRFGKTPYGVAQVAKKYGVPVIALCGMIGEGAEQLSTLGFSEIYGLVSDGVSMSYAMTHGATLLEELAYSILEGYSPKMGNDTIT